LQRLLSTTALLGLLIATAAAFAITERLKLVKSPIYGTAVSKVLSPVCSCARSKANISVKLRRADFVTLTILGPGRRSVRTVVGGDYVPRGRMVFHWDGNTDAGTRAPDGVYQAQIHLADQHRTILLPNRIQLDTRPPRIISVRPNRKTFSPDGDKHADSVRLRYRFDTPAHVRVYLGSQLIIRGRSKKPQGGVTWLGKQDGKPLPAGLYTLSVGGSDPAGNVTPQKRRLQVVVRIRYIRLAHDRIVVQKPGVRFGIGVDTDAPAYWWKLGARHGVAREPLLLLRAPAKPGRYTLTVGERTHRYRAVVVVHARKAGK
jgi:FlgD Ig-like domain